MRIQSAIFICLFIELDLKIRFDFCARLCFNAIWFVKIYEDKETENWNNKYITQFIDTMHGWLSSLSLQVILKLFCLKLSAYSFAQFFYC